MVHRELYTGLINLIIEYSLGGMDIEFDRFRIVIIFNQYYTEKYIINYIISIL